jgi:hypothetical protein
MVRHARIFEKDRATQEYRDTGIDIYEDGRVEGEDETLKEAYKELLWINIKRNNTWGQILRIFTDGYKKAVEVKEGAPKPAAGTAPPPGGAAP